MLEKNKSLFKKVWALIREHYIFLLCVIFIFVGMDLIDSRYWGYNDSEGEIIGGNIRVGLKILGGSILIGISLLTLGINKNNNSKQ